MSKKTVSWPKPVGLILFLVIATLGFYFYRQGFFKKNLSAPEEINQIMAVLSSYMDLPDEIPTLATVTDKSQLESQPFFQKSENGDKVIIFPSASKAILYRPSTKKIIDISNLLTSPVQEEATNSSTLPSPTLAQKINLAIYNGSQEVGLATKMEEEIFGQIEYFKVVDKQDAKSDYQDTLLIDIGGQNQDLVTSLAKDLSAKVASLPPGEAKPAADILIILGATHP